MSNVSFAYNIDDEATPCVCDDCGHTCPISEVEDITDVQERLEPGCIVPAGACPKCGALSYITPEPTITTREAALVVALNELLGATAWTHDDLFRQRLVREARDKALATVAELFPTTANVLDASDPPTGEHDAIDVLEGGDGKVY